MFHLAMYDASIANGSTLLQVAAVADVLLAPAGSGFLVNQTVPYLARVYANGTNLTRVQLTSGSIRDLAPFDVGPVNVGTKVESPARLLRFDKAPFLLKPNEELDAFGVQSNAGAQRIRIACVFSDGPINPVGGKMWSMHWTATTTLTANAWSTLSPTFDNGLPSGTFAVVGSRFISAGALYHRIIFRNQQAVRPGGPAQQAQDDYPADGTRYGEMGQWGTFTNTTVPQFEVYSGSADTSEEGYLDLVQIG